MEFVLSAPSDDALWACGRAGGIPLEGARNDSAGFSALMSLYWEFLGLSPQATMS